MKRLNAWDAFFLYIETPNVHQHTLKIAVVDTTDFADEATFDVFVETFKHRLHRLEPLSYQLVDIPLHLHRPMWRERVELDLGYHLRRVQVPSPGGRRELDALIGEIASTPLDRNHPLWEVYYAEGLADQRVAIISKVHHALADGVASANLMARAMEWPESVDDEQDRYVADPSPSTAELLLAAGVDHLAQLRRLPEALTAGLGGVARLQRRVRQRGQHPDLARDFSPPATFMNHKLSSRRTFATATLSLAEVKQTAKHLGIKINDLLLATASGALRGLLLKYDGQADQPLIATVPASIDPSPDRIAGNELSMMSVSLPVQVSDPLERVRLINVATINAKEDQELLGRRTISTSIEYSPAVAVIGIMRWMSEREKANSFNLTISNVPGPRQRGCIAGAVVTEIYSVGPVAVGAGINITVWSYVDQLNISVLADDRTLSEPHEATTAMLRAFAEIRSAAGLSAQLTEVDTAMPQASDSP